MKTFTGKLTLLLAILFACSISFAAKIQDNTLILGDQNAGVDKEIQMGSGLLKWDQATSKMQVSDDGIGFQSILDLSGNAAALIENAGFDSSVAASALTIDLKVADGTTDPTSGNLVKIAFRNLVAANGAYNIRTVSSARTIVIPSGATLGHVDATDGFIYLYALNNAGVVELAVSSALKDESSRITTVAIDATSDDDGIYSTAARTDVPFRMLARFKSNQTTAGTWAATMAQTSPDAPILADIIDRLKNKIGSGADNDMKSCTIFVSSVVTAPALDFQYGGCVTSVTNNGDFATINWVGSYWSTNPRCTCAAMNGSLTGFTCTTTVPNVTNMGVGVYLASTGVATEAGVTITCMGK